MSTQTSSYVNYFNHLYYNFVLFSLLFSMPFSSSSIASLHSKLHLFLLAGLLMTPHYALILYVSFSVTSLCVFVFLPCVAAPSYPVKEQSHKMLFLFIYSKKS